MDRTSRIGLAICFILLIGSELIFNWVFPTVPAKPRPAVITPLLAATNNAIASSPTTTAGKAPGTSVGPATTPPAPPVEEKLSTLENDALKVNFTSVGAAIKDVELKLQKADNGGNIILNEEAHTNILTLAGWPGVETANFTAKEELATSLTFSTQLPSGLRWDRKYAFGKAPERDTGMSGFLRTAFHKVARRLGQAEQKPEVYTLDVTDTLTNPGATDVTLPDYTLAVGRAEPLYEAPGTSGTRVPNSANNLYLGSGWLAAKYHTTTINDFNPSSFLGFSRRGALDQIASTASGDVTKLKWLAVENQFFAVLLTPATERSITSASFHCYNSRDAEGRLVPSTALPEIEAMAAFPAVTVPAGQSVSIGYSLYAGPKDFNRLDALGQDQGALMNYDGFLPFSLLIVPMLTVLHFWYLLCNNYGVAIILLTLMIKAVTWPLQSMANRSGKRMQALAPKIKELQAKYKDQPEKQSSETFALYKEYGINPVGGCLPMFIQMPVFFSLYFMLQNAVELRGQSFLWVHDLTKPDAVWTAPFLIFGFHPSLHPLPLMVTGLTVVMMRMTPQIGDPQQAKIAQIMPLVFLFFFYNFAAGLSLYYVINNMVSIIQIYRNLKKPMPELKRVPRKKPA